MLVGLAVYSTPPRGPIRRYLLRRMNQVSAIQISRAAFLVLAAALTGGCAAPLAHPVTQGTPRSGLDAESSAQLDSLVRDVCGKSVVLLGEEPHHGGVQTL